MRSSKVETFNEQRIKTDAEWRAQLSRKPTESLAARHERPSRVSTTCVKTGTYSLRVLSNAAL